MSIQAISWTLKQQMESAYLKFTLLAFANYANEYGDTWCSNETLQRITCMNTKTLSKWVKKLEDDGYLVDTGKRQGDTGKIKIYKIVSFETHPKTEVLDQAGIPPKLGGLNTPKIGESPTPPNIDNLKSKPKGNSKKSAKVGLAEWEAATGTILCIEQMKSWIIENELLASAVREMVGEFRERVSAGGNQYADFVSAFKVWLRQGYLTKSMAQLKVPKAAEYKHQTVTTGNSI